MHNWLPNAWLEFRFAARTFAKRPGFAAVAALTLALGIGGTTAVFSIVEAVLLRRLPYKDPGRLAAVWITSTAKEVSRRFSRPTPTTSNSAVTPGHSKAWRRQRGPRAPAGF